MKAALVLALGLLAPSARAEAFPPAPALVWLPEESFAAWGRLDGLLRSRRALRLTAALTPAQAASPAAKAALARWLPEGRLELAARLAGDPYLPLVAADPSAPRPQDLVERAAEARQALAAAFGPPPAGFIPGGGAWDSSLSPPLAAAGAAWALVGPYASTGPWRSEAGVLLVPASPDPLSGAPVLVFADTSPASAFLDWAAEAPEPDDGWPRLSELLSQAPLPPPSSEAAPAWPAWDPAAASASTSAAAAAYARAARALQAYQNSGSAQLSVLDEASESLRRAQAARYFRLAEGLDPEFRRQLLAVYRRLKIPAPESLYAGPSASAASAQERPTGVRAASGPGWAEFSAPAQGLFRGPSLSTGPEAAAWELRSLRVEWSSEAVVFVLKTGGAPPPEGPAPLYEVYMDLNGVLGAGSVRPFAGRGFILPARDAWEFALSISGGRARLYRAGPAGPMEAAAAAIELDPEKTALRAALPRALLRGDPARWGYAAVALAEDPARAGQSPPAAWQPAASPPLLGALASLEVQKSALGARRGARLPAARLSGD